MRRALRRQIGRLLRRAVGVLYYGFGLGVSLIATSVQSVWMQGALLLVGLLVSGGAYYVDSARQYRKVSQEKLELLLTDVLFPLIIEDYEGIVDNPAEIRVNVMLLRYRDVIPVGEGRKLWPWQRTLAVEFDHGSYGEHGERELKWAIDEGVCGTAVEYNRMIWSDLEDTEVHEWDMTQEQLNATRDVGSVLSIPIYVPEDTDKEFPIGVLNIDSRANIDESGFDEEVGKELKKYTNYIGSLV